MQMASGFLQLDLEEGSRDYTAFKTPSLDRNIMSWGNKEPHHHFLG
jgi:hypothetical protein